MSLEKIQNEFIDYLYTLKPAGEQLAQIRSYFENPQRPDPHGGLKVYRGNLLFGIIGAMKESYVMTKVLLGENNFNFFVRDFLFQNPSTNSDLIQYGGGFGDFLSTRKEIEHLAFLSDVARLEWALERAFYAQPEPSFLGELSADWQKTVPVLKGSVQLLSTRYRVHEAWLAFTDKGEEGINHGMFKAEPEYLVIWSDEGAPRVTPVNETFAEWMEGVQVGKSSDAMTQEKSLSEENALEAYRFALRQGWISRK
jgi:hypothetical protein